MQITFPGSSFQPIDVPRSNLHGVYGPVDVRSSEPPEAQLAVALVRPIGTEPLGATLRPGMRVLVIIDDWSSPTPAAQILPGLLTAIQNAGVAHQDIAILIATASRRPMTADQISQKVGEYVRHSYPIIQHDWRDLDQMATLSSTPEGYPVVVNRRIVEADFIIGLQSVVPDRVTGFTGGYSIVDPGCFADTHSTFDIRWDAARYPADAILGRANNPVRKTLDAIGRIAGLDFVVQVVVDGRGEVAGILAGDPIAAYQAIAPTAFQIYAADIPDCADVVVANARPYDSDLFLASKALYAASLAARPGGAVVLLAECPDGVAPTHSQVMQHRVQSVDAIGDDLSFGRMTDVVAGAFLAMLGQVLERGIEVFLVSPGIPDADAHHLRLVSARSPQDALDRARARTGSDASTLVLRQATMVFPRF